MPPCLERGGHGLRAEQRGVVRRKGGGDGAAGGPQGRAWRRGRGEGEGGAGAGRGAARAARRGGPGAVRQLAACRVCLLSRGAFARVCLLACFQGRRARARGCPATRRLAVVERTRLMPSACVQGARRRETRARRGPHPASPRVGAHALRPPVRCTSAARMCAASAGFRRSGAVREVHGDAPISLWTVLTR